MLSRESQLSLVELLMKIIEGENKVEVLRKCLCENYDFYPHTLFQSLSKVNPNYILPKDLKDFLQQNKESTTDQEVYLLVRQYSSLQNGRLSEEDFEHFVLTSTNDTLPYLVSQRIHIREVRPGVRFSFVSLLKEELKLQREVENLKISLFQDPEFSLWKGFEHLNTAGKGYVSEADITDFLKKSGRYISVNDFDALMRRIDIEDDLVISYNEFLEALIPLQIPKNNGRDRAQSKSVSNTAEKSEEIVESQGSQNEERENTEEINPEKEAEDLPLDENELEVSPRFKDSAEVSNSHFETPEKGKSGASRQLIRSKSPDLFEKIGDFFLLLIDNLRRLEFAQQSLLIQTDFAVTQFFKLISKGSEDPVTFDILKEFLDEVNIKSSDSIIDNFLNQFGNKSLEITIEELIKVFCPYDSEYKELIQIEADKEFSQVTFEKAREVVETIFRNFETEERHRKEFEEIGDEEINEIFGEIDLDEDGEIGTEDLRQFLKKLGRNISEKDRNGLIEKHTQDKASIFVSDFRRILVPRPQ